MVVAADLVGWAELIILTALTVFLISLPDGAWATVPKASPRAGEPWRLVTSNVALFVRECFPSCHPRVPPRTVEIWTTGVLSHGSPEEEDTVHLNLTIGLLKPACCGAGPGARERAKRIWGDESLLARP